MPPFIPRYSSGHFPSKPEWGFFRQGHRSQLVTGLTLTLCPLLALLKEWSVYEASKFHGHVKIVAQIVLGLELHLGRDRSNVDLLLYTSETSISYNPTGSKGMTVYKYKSLFLRGCERSMALAKFADFSLVLRKRAKVEPCPTDE